jgi:2-keto-3-deoxy-L-fuconate dehydrogenase
MSQLLSGKTALITAAGAGIGRASALAFHAKGANVWAADINAEALAALAADAPGLNTLQLDVRDEAAIAAAFARIGALDVLFNCAGMVHDGSVLDAEMRQFQEAYDLNVLPMVRTIRAALPAMLERGAGAIINMSSVTSSVTGVPGRCAYGTTKAAVIGLTKSVAADFIRDGLRCNAVAPGTFRSPSWEDRVETLGKEWGSKDKALEMFVQRQPTGRIASAAEIAPIVVYLASDEAAFTTGTVMSVDGGFSL